MNGVICVYKPSGYTSFDIIAIARRLFGVKKIGHSGTLDPMAEGVLPVFVGSATKAVDFCPITDKEYRAAFKLGLTTDTEDITGKVIEEKSGFSITERELTEALNRFVGEITQIPPMYSAVKVGGERLYDLARAGREVERKPRQAEVYSIIVESYADGEGVIDIACSKGTYVRTIIHDMGQILGTGAVMTALQRTKSNGFGLSDCRYLEELRAAYENNPGTMAEYIMPLDAVFDGYPKAYLDIMQTEMFGNGVKLDADKIKFEKIYGGMYSLYNFRQRLVGLGKIDRDHTLTIYRRFGE